MQDLKKRTKNYAISIIKFVQLLPSNEILRIIGKQMLRSGTSVGANYRSACRARSPRDFIAKMLIVEEEADETMYWLELLEEIDCVSKNKLLELKSETNEIVAISVASIRTARKRTRKY
jgi:four helix bundle protein